MKKALCMVLIFVLLLAVPVSADSELQITMQPQNSVYPQYATAMYTVQATGENLHATWYLEYEGNTYNLSDNTNGMEPWEAYAGETYGANQPDSNTFVWFFGGIEEGLNGAQIWCVVEDGHNDVTSQKAIITIQGDVAPPQILKMPAEASANQGDELEIRCVAASNGEAQLEFQWYETTTGRLQDIMAMDGEDSDFIFCNTQQAGVRYFVCCVTGSDGGRAYSSVIPVTVLEAATEQPQTAPPAPVETTAPAPVETTEPIPEETTAPAAEETTAPIVEQTTAPDAVENTTPVTETPEPPVYAEDISKPQEEKPAAMPWWGIALIGLGSAGVGVGAAVLLMKKKK